MKMSFRFPSGSRVVLLLLGLSTTACAARMSASTHRFVMDELANRGTILEHTKVGEREERVVVREANNIVLYRLTTEPAGLAHGDAWGQEPLYTVDTVTRLCYSGRRTLVDCEALKREPALVPYITW